MPAPTFIDVIVNVDTRTLSAMVSDGALAAGTSGNPTPLDAKTGVFATQAAQRTLVSNSGPNITVLHADSECQLRWTISGFDSNVDYTAYFYAGTFVVLNRSALPGIPKVTSLGIHTITTDLYLPPGGDPTAAPEKKMHNILQSSGPAIAAGEDFWAILHFKVIDNSNGNLIGCFAWTQSFQIRGPVVSQTGVK